MLVPPVNFGIVEENLYRCSKLETLNLSFIENLGLKLIIFLMTEEPSRIFKEFMKSMKIEWIVINPNAYIPVTSKDEKNKKNLLATENENKSANNSSENINNLINDSIGDANDKEENSKSISTYDVKQYISNTEYGASNSFFLIHPKVIHQVFNLILDKSNNNILLVDKTALLVGMLRKIQKWQLSSIIDEYRMITGKHKSYNAECFLEFVKIEILQEKPKINENSLAEDKAKQAVAAQEEEEEGEEDDKKIEKKRLREEQKLKIENQKVISDLITDELFDKNSVFESCKKNKNTDTDKQKLKILIDVDLETYDPPVPDYLETIIEHIEIKTKILAQDANEKLQKFDKLELLHKEKKKNKDINKYSMKFNKSKQETTQYEYYKPETKSHRSKISKRLTETDKLTTSIKKITEVSSFNSSIDGNNAGDKKQPFTRSSITFEPLPYKTVEEKLKNDALTKEYGTCVADFVTSIPADPKSSNSEPENTVEPTVADKQIVVVKVPIEDRLQDWFVHKRNIWEEENTYENHREKVYI